jgi:hypothetical protein
MNPAVADHAHTLGFSHAVEFGALLEVLLAAYSLGVAEAGFCESIDVAPVWSRS